MRWLWLVPVAGCAAVLAACGGGGGSSGTTTSRAAVAAAGLEPPSSCYVIVFLAEDVTKADIAGVRRRLLANRAVTQVSYVSKELELRRFGRLNPEAAKQMAANPFADRFEVVPRTPRGIFAIVGDFAIRGGPIMNAKPSKTCAARPRTSD